MERRASRPRGRGAATLVEAWRSSGRGARILALATAAAALAGAAYWLDAPSDDGGERYAYAISLSDELRTKLSPPPPTRADVREELECLALNIYFEARGEPRTGKLAVGHVVMNRVGHASFPDTVCTVVRQGGEEARHRCQFSWWCDGKSDRPTEKRAWLASQDIARHVFWGRTPDPTEGALWYHATHVKPVWRTRLARARTIGNHIFYRLKTRPAQLASRLGLF